MTADNNFFVYKKVDLILQAVTLVLSAFYSLFTGEYVVLFFGFYFGVGGLQFISFIAHLFAGRAMKIRVMRLVYGVLLLLMGAGLAIVLPFDSYGNDLLITYLIVVIYFTPLMAIYYIVICSVELYQISKRIKLGYEEQEGFRDFGQPMDRE